MEPNVVVRSECNMETCPSGKSDADSKSIPDAETKLVEIEPINNAVDQSQQLTVAEKMMLDFLLEKQRKGLTTTPTVNKNQRRVHFVDPPQPTVRKQFSKDDRSVTRAMDQLNRLSDDQLMSLFHECNVEDGDPTDTGNFLAWWMTCTQLKDGPLESQNSKPKRGKSMNRATSFEPSQSNDRKSEEQSDRPSPKTIPGEPGRFIFSFMQEPGSKSNQKSSSPPGTMHKPHEKNKSGRNIVEITEPGKRRDVKRMKSERRRPRRGGYIEGEEENEEEESTFSSDMEDWSELLVDIALMGNSKSREKKPEPDAVFWNPDEPRPMPSRLRRSMKAKKRNEEKDEKPGTSKSDEK